MPQKPLHIAQGDLFGNIISTDAAGTNTGDQTITLTGDVTGTGTNSFATTLSPTGVTASTYGSSTQVPVVTVDAKGRITGVSTAPISGSAGGTVTSVAATGTGGVTVTGSPITGTGTLAIGLGAITPTSVAASGAVTGSNLSGTNTGDQTITLTGDVTGTGTGSFVTTLSNTAVSTSLGYTPGKASLTTDGFALTQDALSLDVGRVAPFTLTTGQSRTISVKEGDTLKLTSAASTSGTVQRVSPSQTWAIGPSTSASIGPFSGTQQFVITCTTGSISAEVRDAVVFTPLATLSGVSNYTPRALPLNNYGSRRTATTLSGINWHKTSEAPSDFEFVRLCYDNVSTNPVTVTGCVAASSSAVNPAIPDQAVVPVTFNGAASGICAAAPTNRDFNSSRAADQGVACLTTTIRSDWMLCPKVDRTDTVGAKPLVMGRAYLVESVGGNITRSDIDTAAGFNSPGFTRKEWTYLKSGADATGAAAWSGYIDGTTLFASMWVETLSRARARIVMGSGDSTVKGTGGTSGATGVNSFGNRACDLVSTNDYPCVWANTAWGGTQHKHWCTTDIISAGATLVVAGNTSISQFEQNLQKYKPTDAIILTWSTNDAATFATPTAAEFKRELARALYMGKLCTDNGVKPIFCTFFPRDGLTTTGQTNFIAALAVVRSVLAGPNLLDVHAAIGDPVTCGYLAGKTDDGTHPSESATAQLGVLLATVLRATQP